MADCQKPELAEDTNKNRKGSLVRRRHLYHSEKQRLHR